MKKGRRWKETSTRYTTRAKELGWFLSYYLGNLFLTLSQTYIILRLPSLSTMPFLTRYPHKTTVQDTKAGIASPTATADALVARPRPTFQPMSVVMRYLKKSIFRGKWADTRSPSSATNTGLALEQRPRLTLEQVPKSRLAEHSTDAQAAYQFIHDELELESDPNMNMASYGKL